MKTICVVALVAVMLALAAVPASAQPVISAKSGLIAYVEGNVYLADQLVEPSATKFPDIKENSVVRTTEGRAEVLLTPGVVLHLGENSSFRLLTNRLIDTRLELLTGSAVVDAAEVAKDTNVTVVFGTASAVLAKAGHFRFDTQPMRLKVFAGIADVTIDGQHIEAAAGKMVTVGGELAEKFDRNDTDSLDNWARRRSESMAMANVSAANSLYKSYTSMPVGLSGVWGYNPYFGMYTYIPANGRYCDPFYGLCYWSPSTVMSVYYQPRAMPNYGGYAGSSGSYASMGSTSSGYSGTVASASSVSSSPAASSSMGSSAASSAGSSSVGHGGGGGGGGHGH